MPRTPFASLNTWNANAFQSDDGQVTMEFHGKWIRYLGPDGNWAPIDCNLKPNAEGWSVTDAPFNFTAPKFADDEAFFESDVRWDIWGNEEITDDPFGMYISAEDADHVAGELYDINGNGRTDAILYKNAFPQWNADLIYFVKHGRAPRLEKLVRFNADPEIPDAEIPVHFSIRYTGDVVIKQRPQQPTARQLESATAKMAKAYKEYGKQSKQALRAGRKLEVEALEALRTPWTKGKLRTKQSILHRPSGSASSMRGLGMKDFHVWDSGERKEGIEVEYENTGENTYRLTKHVPTDFFIGSTFPVFTDVVGTFYPDPDTETNTVDGHAGDNANGSAGKTWSDIRDDPGTVSDDSGTAIRVAVKGGTTASQYEDLYRGILLFDTSFIPTGASSLSGTLVMRTSTITIDSGASNQWAINVCGSNPASNTSLAASDYGNLVFTDYSDTVIQMLDLGADTDETWTLNAAGIAAITKGGITKYGLCLQEDIDGAGNYNQTDRLNSTALFYSADTAGTDDDPTLSITFTYAVADPTNLAAAAVDGTTDIDLTWDDNASDEDGYDVEVSDTGAGGWTTLASLPANTTSYQHEVGANSTQKYYRVKATSNSYSDSGYTSTVNATTAPVAPSSPTISHANGSTVLTIGWTDNSSDETGFSVERSDNGSTGWAEVGTVDAGVTTYADDVGVNDSRKYYRVRAQRSGDSVNSGYTSTVNEITAPAAPSALAVAPSQGALQLRVSWTDNSSSETTFSIERRIGGGASFAEITTDTTSPYDDTSLSEDTLYVYRVRAYNATDDIYSSFSEIVAARTLPPAPTNLRVLPSSDANAAVKMMLLWDDPTVTATGIKVERSLDDADWSTLATTAKGALQYEDTGLTKDTTYYYRVSTVGPDGTSDPTTSVAALANIATTAGLELAINKKLNNFPSE